MPDLLLVRHATSLPPAPGGPDDHHRPLTSDGLAEAEALAGSLLTHAPTRFLSSPYLRAVQTVAPAATACGLTVETHHELREWESGIGPTPEWQTHYRRCWDDPQLSIGEGESHQALTSRAVDALHRAATGADAGATVVASHGTWIARALLGLGCSVDADFWFSMPMPAVYEVQVDNHVFRVIGGPGLPG